MRKKSHGGVPEDVIGNRLIGSRNGELQGRSPCPEPPIAGLLLPIKHLTLGSNFTKELNQHPLQQGHMSVGCHCLRMHISNVTGGIPEHASDARPCW